MRARGFAVVLCTALVAGCTGGDAAPASSTPAPTSSAVTSTSAPTESTQDRDRCDFDYGAQLALYDTTLRTTRWTTDVPWASFQRAWVDRGVVVTRSFEGLTALQVVDGTPAWSWQPAGGPDEPINAFGHQFGTALAATSSGLTAIDTATGGVRWKVTDLDPQRVQVGAPSPDAEVDGSTPLYTNENGTITARDPEDGSVVWTFRTIGDWGFAPVLTDREVLHTAFEGAVYSLDPATGDQRWVWSSRPGVGVGTAFVGTDDIVVVPTTPYLGNPENVEPPADASQLIGLDRRTGSVRWTVPVPEGTFYDQFRIIDGVVAFTASDAQGGAVRAGIDAATGIVLWTAPGTTTTELRVEGGMLFESPYSGGQARLVRLDPATGAALLPTGVEHSIRGLVADQQDWLVGVATRADAAAAIDADGTGTLMRMDPATGVVTVAATFRDAVQQLIPGDHAVIVLAADDALFCD